MDVANRTEAEGQIARGEYGSALKLSQDFLADHPGDLDAEHLIGRIYAELGRAPFATLMLQRVVALRPDDAEARASLGRAQRLAGDLRAARDTLLQGLVVAPRLARLSRELAEAELALGDVEEALAHVGAAIELEPADVDGQLLRARALRNAGRDDEARDAFAAAERLDPDAAVRFKHLARLHQESGSDATALHILEAARFFQPENTEFAHLLRAARGAESDDRAADEYLVEYFDGFATTFDERLGELKYRTPERLVALALSRLGPRATELEVLDAGCGTGLCGPLLRPIAERLDGVDISSGMVKQAEAREIYDGLFVEELTSFLESARERYDLVVAADVLVYFGDLTEVMQRMASALRPGGLVAVSVELNADPGRRLGSSGRWAHGRHELERAADAAGLQLEITESELRHEFARPVLGLLAVGGRASRA